MPRPRLADVHALTPPARFGGVVASGLRDVTHDPEALDSAGFRAVVADFEGRLTCARCGDVRAQPVPAPVPGRRRGQDRGDWKSSLDRAAYTDGVRRVRARIAVGDMHQAGLCRVLSAPSPVPAATEPKAARLLAIASNRETSTVTDTSTGTVTGTREKTDTYAHESEAAYAAASGRTAS